MTTQNDVVSHEAWLEARKRLLAREKEFTQERERLSEQRRALPWERIDKRYTFEGAAGTRSLAELFDGKSQLVVYHFMYGVGEGARPCRGCSFWADNFNGIGAHLKARDVNLVAVSRAPLPTLQAFAKRMQWTFPWLSSQGNDFTRDFGVSFSDDELAGDRLIYNYGKTKAHGPDMPGISVFYRDTSGAIFHTYSCYSRGLDMLNNAYQYLDIVPKGRDEASLSSPMAWVRLHDEY
jgi:predicted dithiol-disulfide oxidoreductase (DUF899 family)